MSTILTPVTSVDLLDTSAQQIDAIRTAAGLTQQQFDALCLPVLRAYANRVQSLPFSSTIFTRPQGAWECGLVCATVAYQYASTVIFFPNMGAEERRLIERQCRYMSFVATLAACLSLTVGAVKIKDADTEYHPLLSSQLLSEWLLEHPRAAFAWNTEGAALNSQVCAAITSRFVPAALVQNFDLRAVLMIYDPIAIGTKLVGVESTLAKVVRQSIQKVLEHYGSAEARLFKESSAPIVPPVDASAVASQMAANANPTMPANPLASTTAPSGPAAAPAQQSPGAAATHGATASASPSVPTHPAPPAPSMTGESMPAPEVGSSGDPVLGKDKVLVEWFAALKQHAKYPDLAKHLTVTDEGLLVPINMLGLFGVSGPTIRKKMEEAGFVVRRSDDARCLILIPALRAHFIIAEAATPA